MSGSARQTISGQDAFQTRSDPVEGVIRVPARRAWPWAVLVLTYAMGWIGCVTEPPRVPARELAAAPPFWPQQRWRMRLPVEHDLPLSICQRLCPEFDLIQIRDRDEWSVFCRTAAVEPKPVPDFSSGMVVGIAAHVGEPVQRRWPVTIRYVRRARRDGWLQAKFEPGIYHPLQSPAYCALAYVPDLRRIAFVEVNRRLFMIP